jgi:hypothetical protein
MPRPPFSAAKPNGTPRRLWRWIAVAAAAGLLLALVGPFGTWLYAGTGARLIYWIAATLAGLLIYGGALTMVRRGVAPESRFYWPAMVGAALIASVPQMLITRALAFRLWPDLARQEPSWLLWYANTALIGLIATAAILLLLRRTAPPAPARLEPSAAEPDLAGRPPASIFALQMEDHYVRVHGATGSELLLLPLARAIAAVEAAPGAEGLQVHRSWWVARHAVAAVEGNPRAMRLRLHNGVTAPVARTAVARLRAAGWIAG